MGEKFIVGPFNMGLRNDKPPFMIDNENFPVLKNAYQWRGRVKRKRGTEFLTRLQRFFDSTNTTFSSTSAINLVAGSANILTGFTSLETNASLVPGSITITDNTTGEIFTDDSNGNLIGSLGGNGTVNYATGDITIVGGGADSISASFSYFPLLPVMGLEESILAGNQFPGTIAFDTVYAYNIQTATPYNSYSVSFFKNPSVDAVNLPAYVPKTNWTNATWNGQNYQQFWSTNYQGALWVTNGITVPFTTTNIGMQFQMPTIATQTSATTVDFTIAGSPLVIGDFVFANEFTGASGDTLNFQTGYVINVVGAVITVKFPNATIGAAGLVPGILQYLTTRSDITKDCIRWYDGDPTNGSATNPSFVTGKGWVNFMPPLSQGIFSIAEQPARQYYLVGARMILPFKDRLLFFGPVIQASTGNPIYLQDTIIYSQNGTPYYTASFTGNIFTPGTGAVQLGFEPILVPINQTADPKAYWEDQTGFGGFVSAGIDRMITTASTNEDALIVGFDANIQTRVIYSGNDIVPFNFFIINAELGSASTFSAINMDAGVISKGNRGYIISSQTEVQRIDLEIPDEVFETRLTDNGTERVCAIRDFINEWIYFTYPSNLFEDSGSSMTYRYPTKTLQYNYRDNSWGTFFETYTTYGSWRAQTGYTWATIGDKFSSWNAWNEPWDDGESTLLQPQVIGGNQQGFVLIRGVGTSEGKSLYIQSFSGSTVTCIDHCLSNGDFIIINNCLGTVGASVNGFVFEVTSVTENTFVLLPNIASGLTYLGLGVITRIYVPLIQTKQFPGFWEQGRKTRIGPQQYLFTATNDAQITLQIYLSQNSADPYNFGPVVPAAQSINNSLIYSQVLFTCPESTNLGLTPANSNLQTPTAFDQAQIWHRKNTSLIGDTVQIGFTLSKDQIISPLQDLDAIFTITNATQANPCVLTITGPFNIAAGDLILIQNIVGMTELNGNIYQVLSATSTQITINVDSTAFTPYISGGTVTQVYYDNIFDEIELHGFILDLSPSQLLV